MATAPATHAAITSQWWRAHSRPSLYSAPVTRACSTLSAASAALAEDRPLLLAVDDARWADAPSHRFLDHLARRLPTLPVVLVTAGWADGTPVPPASVLHLWPLDLAAVRELTPDAEPLAERCHALSGGNPLLLHALLRALPADGREDVDGPAAEAVSAIVVPRLRALDD